MRALLRVGICFGIAVMLLSLLVSGEITLVVHPRFKGLIAVSILLLIVLGLVQLWNLKRGEIHRIGAWGYLVILLPLLFFMVSPPKALDASIAANKGVSYMNAQALAKQQKLSPKQSAASQKGSNPNDSPSPEQAQPSDGTEPEIVEIDNPYKELVPKIKAEPVITFTEKNYADYFNTINMYPKEFEGKKIRLKGFVYRDETLKKNEFVTGRFTVTCCTADATVIGMVTTGSHAGQVKSNQWIEVTGTIQTVMYEGYEMPVIKLDSYKPVSPPKDPYIYF
ncbi:TIGR03943 family putative permease subunit [Lihuaxuella thermophila]|uniref:Putative membrane protein n=1 Tax=Lihuaxuella thermophila TaxID=1173111 RepID=A0A1H8GTX1_9BACL|nr:TIGR03943 family protein [Lihuaxuella thermophila]SEN47416.1 putative membrane protein [Lihuaxuella thermophila]